jgi:NitT/TauT family transport system substrate-binding protein
MTLQELARTSRIKHKPQVAIMNAVHDLPVLVARDEGFFRDEGLDIDFVTTPGMAQVTTSHFVKFDSIFDRPLDSAYNEGGIDTYRMCEWGIMKRAVEANTEGLRPRKIVALGAAMSSFAVVVRPDSKFYEPEMLKNVPIAVTPNNGSHFTTLKIMEGFLPKEHIKTTTAGSMPKRIEALREGKVQALSLMEPWISYAQKLGLRILVESHSTRSEAAGDDLDADTLKKMFRAQARACELLEKEPASVREIPGRGDRRPAARGRVPGLAPAERAAAALHARALGRHLQLDGRLEHDRARRNLRKHRGQQGMGVVERVTVAQLQAMKRAGRKIVGVVAWDFQIARSPTAPAWTWSPSAIRSA